VEPLFVHMGNSFLEQLRLLPSAETLEAMRRSPDARVRQRAKQLIRRVARAGLKALDAGHDKEARALYLRIPVGPPPVIPPRSRAVPSAERGAARTPRRARTVRTAGAATKPSDDGPPPAGPEPPRRRAERRPTAEGAKAPTAAPLLVSDANAEAVVGLSGRQLRRLIKEHGLPVLRVGRRTLVRASDLLALFAGAPPPAPEPWDESAVIASAARGSK